MFTEIQIKELNEAYKDASPAEIIKKAFSPTDTRIEEGIKLKERSRSSGYRSYNPFRFDYHYS